ncbi:MAG: polynucleotide adenylyltransferase PcnB [Rhabdochlamydiaceae bacterium]|nr:polynucleotide adenylyltransferase PcnB [Rhabdochlamydiaceae bacterium]
MQQKIYSQDAHQLDIRTIDKDALYVLDKLTASGYIAYLVGGGVRDLLLKKKPKDFDISTSAEPEEIKKLFRNCILIGRRFRLAHIRFGRKIIEVSTFRSGDNENDALILRDNVWGSQEEDVLRRDFTINGLFYDAAKQTVIDYVGGFPDLEKGHLRTIGQPFIRFKQDPVRMIRLLKFRARFGFEIDHDTRLALIESKHEILKSSSARILEELLRMLESGASEPFFRLMIEYGLLQLMLPALASFMEMEEGEQIYSFLQSIDEHTLTEGNTPLDRSLLLAVLAFPLLEKRLEVLYAGRDKPPHLGEIQKEVLHIVREAFGSFFLIPKRLKIITTTLLFLQFKLNAPDKKRSRPPRIPQDPSLPMAIELLALRSHINPSLQKTAEYWQTLVKPLDPTENPLPEVRKRRRRRRSKPSSPPSDAT